MSIKIIKKLFDYDCRYGRSKSEKKHKKKMNYLRYYRKMLKKHTTNHHLNQ